MTLGENKKITLGLIEEYSPTNQYLTDDEDIRARLNLVYSPNYQDLSEEKGILKTKTIVISENSDIRTEMSLPMDCRQFRRLVGLDDNGDRISPEYDIIGKKLYLKTVKGKYIMEYYAYPQVITESTSDDYMLEIDQDAQMKLTWLVAGDILKVDPSADYTAFSAEFQRKLERWDTRRTLPSAEVSGGI